MVNNDKWGALSMSERASLVNTYVQNGISSLKEMKEHYNSFDEGGLINPFTNKPFTERELENIKAQGLTPEQAVANIQKMMNANEAAIKEANRIEREKPKPTIKSRLAQGFRNMGKEIEDKSNELLKKVYHSTVKNSRIVDKVRQRIYDNIDPVGYNNFTQRVKDAIFGTGEKVYNTFRDDIFASYLGIPAENRHNVENKAIVVPSMYSPTQNSNENSNYHALDISDKATQSLINATLRDVPNIGGTTSSNVLEDAFGPHTISRGLDEKGEYVSYYDLWDLDPTTGESASGEYKKLKKAMNLLGTDASLGLGTPIKFYDRVYLNDFFNATPIIEEGDYYGGYIKPAYLEGSKYGNDITAQDYENIEEELPTYKSGGKLNLNALGGPLYNKHNPIESFSGSSKIPVVRRSLTR